jgi:sugar/nucleoside kinase (ribokinase family)
VDLLVIGDANLDLILRGDVIPRFGQAEQLVDGADLVLAGSAGIVAAGAGRLGLRTALVAHVGADEFGAVVRAQLSARGVDTGSVGQHPDAPTGLSVILSRPDDRAILTRLGAIERLRPEQDVPDEVLSRARHVHVAGWFLIPGLTTGGPALLARARAAGCTTSLDTNWDPHLRWTGLPEALPHVDVLLPNRTELLALAAGLTGEPTDDVEQAAGQLRRHGPVIAMKASAEGAVGWDDDGRHTAPGLPVTVVDTTGAGDSFDAAFLAARLAGRPFGECLRWAAVAGSLSTRAVGGTAAQATPAELSELV